MTEKLEWKDNAMEQMKYIGLAKLSYSLSMKATSYNILFKQGSEEEGESVGKSYTPLDAIIY